MQKLSSFSKIDKVSNDASSQKYWMQDYVAASPGITFPDAIVCNQSYCRIDYPCLSSSACGSVHANLPTGLYAIKICGAQGGNMERDNGQGGKGGCSEGILELKKKQTFIFFIGGRGESWLIEGRTKLHGGFNGGGDTWNGCGAGGGGSDVRLIDSDSLPALASRIIVAGGGGGANDPNYGGDGGGLTGKNGNPIGEPNNIGTGGTQTEGGKQYYPGSFGVGGNINEDVEGGGGGGGYYGGGRGTGRKASGGGGSGFVSGMKGCNAVESEVSTAPSGNPFHYSGLWFSEATMTTGERYGPGYAEIKILENKPKNSQRRKNLRSIALWTIVSSSLQ